MKNLILSLAHNKEGEMEEDWLERFTGLTLEEKRLARLNHEAGCLIAERRLEELTREHFQAMAEVLERFRKDNKWIDGHMEELREKYPDKYIAVFQEKVVASCNPDPLQLNRLREVVENQGIIFEWVAAKFIPREKRIQILALVGA